MFAADLAVVVDHRGGRTQQVRELAEIAGPCAAIEQRHHVGRDAQRPPAGARQRLALQHLLHHHGEIGTVAQRRQPHDEPVQPVVQILAEAVLRDHLAQIAVRRADDRDVHADRLRRAERIDDALLQYAQQPHLQRIRHVADLVEKQRAAVRLQQLAGRALAARARKRALLVAEQLRLDQRLRNRRAVHRDERPVATRRIVVDRLREQFLAGAGLARDQHRNVLADHLAHLRDHGRDLRIAGVEIAEPRQARGAMCGGGPRGRHGAAVVHVHRAAALRTQRTPELHARTDHRAVAEIEHHVRLGARAHPVDQLRARHVEQRRERMRTQRGQRHAELELRAAVRGQKAAVGGERDDSFHQRAEKFRPAVKRHLQRLLERRRKQMVLDHLHRHLRERHRVLVIAAMVARHVQHADHVAVRIENRHARTGQEVVRREKVLVAVHDHRTELGQRRADRVGALPVLRPVRAGAQRDALRTAQEVVVADRMQDQPFRIGQHDHALRIDDLLVQRLHHRHRVHAQHAVLLALEREFGGGQHIVVGACGRLQAERLGPLMGLPDRGRRPAGRLRSPCVGGRMNVVAHCLLRGSFRSVAGLFCPDTSKHRAIEAIATRCHDACAPRRRFERSLKDDQRLSRSHIDKP